METENKTVLTVESTINAPVEKVWELWTLPEHIVKWSYASDDWHTPHATNDLQKGGSFSSRMEAKDGSMGFDFGGVYDEVRLYEFIAYTLGDNRKVSVTFSNRDGKTNVIERFEAEATNPLDMQQAGWKNIMDNFKKYVEGNA